MPAGSLTPTQRSLLDAWLGEHRVLADHTWPGQTTTVLEVHSPRSGRVIVKASTGATMDHHLVREIRAHLALGVLGDGFPTLLHHDEPARLLVTRHLAGAIAEGTPWELDAGVHHDAGALLARIHGAADPQRSETYQVGVRDTCGLLLERGAALIDPRARAQASERLEGIEPGPVEVVWTHGDVQPRNWLVDDRASAPPRTMLIDLGRADLRPWYSDLVRLHHQGFVGRPDLRAAFVEGLGRDPDELIAADERDGWHLEHLLQSVGTVVWATDMDDHRFAQQGREMLARTLREWDAA